VASTYTYKGSVVSKAIKDFIELNKGALGISVVFYGDQQTFPSYPAVCVEPAITTRELSGMPYQTDNLFTVNILVYFSNLDGIENIQEICDDLSERLQDTINTESIAQQFAGGTRFGDIVVSGHTARLEYGYKMLANRLTRANRLVWIGFTKTRLVGE
jgi:hypothetical protein